MLMRACTFDAMPESAPFAIETHALRKVHPPASGMQRLQPKFAPGDPGGVARNRAHTRALG